jgi:hypothetical protein
MFFARVYSIASDITEIDHVLETLWGHIRSIMLHGNPNGSE